MIHFYASGNVIHIRKNKINNMSWIYKYNTQENACMHDIRDNR